MVLSYFNSLNELIVSHASATSAYYGLSISTIIYSRSQVTSSTIFITYMKWNTSLSVSRQVNLVFKINYFSKSTKILQSWEEFGIRRQRTTSYLWKMKQLAGNLNTKSNFREIYALHTCWSLYLAPDSFCRHVLVESVLKLWLNFRIKFLNIYMYFLLFSLLKGQLKGECPWYKNFPSMQEKRMEKVQALHYKVLSKGSFTFLLHQNHYFIYSFSQICYLV